MRVIRRGDDVLIISRYSRGALIHIGLTLLVVVSALVHAAWTWLFGRRPLEFYYAGYLIVGGGGAILLALWGLAYFYRRDELSMMGESCSFASRVPFQPVRRRTFHRSEMKRLTIGQTAYVYRLQLDVGDEMVSIYSNASLSKVRGAAEFLMPYLGLPLEESLQ